MDDLQFNEEQEFSRPIVESKPSIFVRLILSPGIVSTTEAANYVLLGVAGMCILATFFVLFSNGAKKPPPPSYKEGQNILMPPGTAVPAP